jgi:multidrug efflux pump subunit AcrA (membrane-fusion protein)
MLGYLAFLKKDVRIVAPILLALGMIAGILLRGSTPVHDVARMVQTAQAIHADVSDASSFTGTLEPVRSVDIAAKSGGQVTALSVDIGSRVGAGQAIAQLDASQARATAASLSQSIEAVQQTHDATAALYDQQIASAEGAGGSQTATVSTLTDAAILARQIDDTLGILLSMRSGAPTSNRSPFPESDLAARDSQSKIIARTALADFQNADVAFQAFFSNTLLDGTPSQSQIDDGVSRASALLTDAKLTLSAAYTALLATVSSAAVSDATIDGSKADIAGLGTQAQAVLSRLHDTASSIDTLKKERDAKLAEAHAQITQLQGQLSVSETLLADGTVRAPFAGVITEKSVERGAIVGAGTPLVHLVDDSQLKLVVGVPDIRARTYHVGDRATVFLDSGASVSAHISKIYPGIDSASRKVSVELALSNPGRSIATGSYARAVFEKSRAAQVAVPRAAVYTQYGTSYVFVLEGVTARRHVVELGAQSEDLIEIKSGLTAGETVVTSGVAYLRDGDVIATSTRE